MLVEEHAIVTTGPSARRHHYKGPKVQRFAHLFSTLGILNSPIHIQHKLLVQHLANFKWHIDHSSVKEETGRAFGFARQDGFHLLLVLGRAMVEALFLQVLDAGLRSVGRHVEHRGNAKHIVITIGVALGRDDCAHADVFDHQIRKGRRLRSQRRVGQEERFDAIEEFFVHIAKDEVNIDLIDSWLCTFGLALLLFILLGLLLLGLFIFLRLHALLLGVNIILRQRSLSWLLAIPAIVLLFTAELLIRRVHTSRSHDLSLQHEIIIFLVRRGRRIITLVLSCGSSQLLFGLGLLGGSLLARCLAHGWLPLFVSRKWMAAGDLWEKALVLLFHFRTVRTEAIEHIVILQRWREQRRTRCSWRQL